MSDGLKTQILSMPDNPTLDDLDQLIRAPANTLITLWTMQQPEAVQQLRDTGRLTVDPEISLGTYCEPGKRAAYAWMQEQMKKRMVEYSCELPIWASFSRPPQTTRAGDQLLRVQIRKDRMLVGFYQPWNRLRGIMDWLERSPSAWPPVGHLPYFAACTDDEQQPMPAERDCRDSWEKMFDLKLARNSGFRWSPISLQAMLPALDGCDVRECLPISLSESVYWT